MAVYPQLGDGAVSQFPVQKTRRLRTVIKGDKGAPFGPIQDVMDILQKVKITRFSLVTELEKN